MRLDVGRDKTLKDYIHIEIEFERARNDLIIFLIKCTVSNM